MDNPLSRKLYKVRLCCVLKGSRDKRLQWNKYTSRHFVYGDDDSIEFYRSYNHHHLISMKLIQTLEMKRVGDRKEKLNHGASLMLIKSSAEVFRYIPNNTIAVQRSKRHQHLLNAVGLSGLLPRGRALVLIYFTRTR